MRKYKKPVLNVEQFTANEFIAACGESGKTYKFVCNANSNSWFSNGGFVYEENGKKEGLQHFWEQDADNRLGSYHPCNETHIAESYDTDFSKGYLTTYSGAFPKEVIIWKGSEGDNIHCTTNLDISKWETAKS